MSTILERFDEARLKELYHDALIDKRSIGVDGITNKKFLKRIDDEAGIIQRKVENESFNFSFYKEKLILKGRDSNPRVISVPTNRDKLVLKVLHAYLKEVFDGDLIIESIHRKIKDIKNHIQSGNYDSFVKVDIKDFFPRIDHEILRKLLRRKISDQVAKNLIDKAITQTTVSPDDRERIKYANTRGVPQGLSISGLLASIYLSHIDNKHTRMPTTYQYYRFVDDILILCHEDESEAIRNEIARDMQEIGLEIHPFGKSEKKSSYGKIMDGFQFLGYQFIGHLVTVRPSSVDKIYDGINRVFLKHYRHSGVKSKKKRVNYLYKRLNYKITGCVIEKKQYGWLYFFSFINDQKLLYKLDAHVKRACKRFKVPYDEAKIKKFSRAYYELSKMETTNYIPSDKKEFKK